MWNHIYHQGAEQPGGTSGFFIAFNKALMVASGFLVIRSCLYCWISLSLLIIASVHFVESAFVFDAANCFFPSSISRPFVEA